MSRRQRLKRQRRIFWSCVAVGVALFVFGAVTLALAQHQLDAAAVVNEGCARHGGVASWGGDESYSARCKDGYAFTGETEYWDWPY
jgi:hypothetical protein